MCYYIRQTFFSLACVFIFMQWNTFHFIVKVFSELRKAAPVRQTGNFMHKSWYTCNRQWKLSAEGPNFVFRKRKVESKSTFLNESYESYRFGTFSTPNPSCVEQGDSGHVTHLCGRRWGYLHLTSSYVLACVRVCYVQIFLSTTQQC